MEKIINNPGLQHLAENIFLNLNSEDLKQCQLINQSASKILENPLFWMKKLIQSEQMNERLKKTLTQSEQMNERLKKTLTESKKKQWVKRI